MSPSSYQPASKSISQTLVWTALPQGPGGPSGTVRLSVLVSPQLQFSEVVGYRSEQSTQLSSFPDFVNWPATIANAASPLRFEVVFGLAGGQSVRVTASPDLSGLRPDCWAAMFEPASTRVDSYGFTDWSQKTQNTFSVTQAHSDVVGLYNGYSGDSAASNATAADDPTSWQDPSQLDLPAVTSQAPLGGASSKVPANVAAHSAVNPSPSVQDALAFHAAPANDSPLAAQSVPILDFHAGISSLGHHAELLPLFGLCFTMILTLPDAVAAADSFTVTALPSWTRATPPTDALGDTPPLVPSTDVPLATRATSRFLPAAADPRLYQDGSLNLQLPQFAVLDVDVDRAAHSLRAYARNLQSTSALHAPPPGTTLSCKLPSLRNAGLSLAWSGWGGQGDGLNALASRQSSLAAAVAGWLALPAASRPQVPAYTLMQEDLLRGWRIDVKQGATWQSLHWRHASYTFGPASGHQVSVAAAQPYEGTLVPTASHAPTAGASEPDTIDVHEIIARWTGWSLATPRPGGQVNDDGSISPSAVGNPAVPTDHSDEYGNVNPQMSSVTSIPTRGIAVHDPLTGALLGTTGLPTLRFGDAYQLAVRTVDPAGWSIPQGAAAATASPLTPHSRWEPVRAPIVVPVAPLGAGEGIHNIAIRMDEPGVPAAPSGRLLFPPKVHELLAEEHGALDSSGRPDPARYAVIAALADGSPETLHDAVVETSAGAANVVLPTPIPAPLRPDSLTTPSLDVPVVSWLADPASAGYAVYFEPPPGYVPPVQTAAPGSSGPSPEFLKLRAEVVSSVFTGGTYFASFVQDRSGIPSISPVFTDLWSGSWPEVQGKLLLVAPEGEGLSVQNPGGGEQLPGGVVRPGLLGLNGEKVSADPEVVAIGLTPGAVYQIRLASVFPSALATDPARRDTLGLLPYTLSRLQGVLAKGAELYAFLLGQIPQLTPYHTVQLVYAVRIPLLAPQFSPAVTFVREPNDITVQVSDPQYSVDIPTTSTVTYEATWTDPIDDPSEPANEPASDTQTVTQRHLVASVGNIYADPIAADPMVPTTPPPGSIPFGTVVPDQGVGASGQTGTLSAVHRIGDTKHHLVTYTPTAATRFAPYFASTVQVALQGTEAYVLDRRGIDVNSVRVKVAASGKPVPAGEYRLDAAAGTIALVPPRLVVAAEAADAGAAPEGLEEGDRVLDGPGRPAAGHPPTGPGPVPRAGTAPPLSGVELSVSYVPTDTRVGPPFQVHIPSTSTPPPVKVVKVAPSWKLESSGTPGTAGFSYRRIGNTLRVYLERPWWVTGADEMLAVLTPDISSFGQLEREVVATVGTDQVSLLALDPISAPAPGSAYSQSQLRFVTPSAVPTTGGPLTGTYVLEGGNPVRVPSPIDPFHKIFQVFGYTPSFDAETDSWYADVQLQLDSFADDPPPGYFVRLVLARFQPYSISTEDPEALGISEAKYLSPTTLVTYAQPLPDRTITVVDAADGTLAVTVTGPGYHGFRPAPFRVDASGAVVSSATDDYVHDRLNDYAPHPNSDKLGSPSSSTMVVEVQEQDATSGFSGELGWRTIPGFVTVLTAQIASSPSITWTTSADALVQLPPFVERSSLRLRVSELDYFPYRAVTPSVVDTRYRRPFVATIPL